MKRFTILFTSLISVLAFSAVLQAWSEFRTDAKKTSDLPKVYDSTGAMLEAIHAERPKAGIAPVYDATGAMLDAMDPRGTEVQIAPVYDSTGAMLDAINAKEVKVNTTLPIVYDATGAMLEAVNP